MEDALSLRDAFDAALRFRITRTPEGVCIEPGTSDDHLFDLDQIDSIIRVALERGDLVETDERTGTPDVP